MSQVVSLAPRGLNFTRGAIAVALARTPGDAKNIAAARWGEDSAPCMLVKAAVAAGSSVPGQSWGSDLTTPSAAQEFFSLVMQASVVGRLSGRVEVPLNTRTLGLTSGSTAHWVREGAPKPISTFQATGETLPPLKTAAVVVVTKEVVEFSSSQTEARVNSDLQRGCVELLDRSFIDVDNSGVANVSPASVTNGATPIASAGNPAADVAALIAAFDGDLASAYFITDPTTATQIALARDAGGSFAFPDCGARGGSIVGIPLLTSRSSPRDSSGGILVLLDASAVGIGSEGIRIDRSEVATLQMSDSPDNPVDASTVLISLWQHNLVGFLVEISANWRLARPDAVAVVTGAMYPTEAP